MGVGSTTSLRQEGLTVIPDSKPTGSDPPAPSAHPLGLTWLAQCQADRVCCSPDAVSLCGYGMHVNTLFRPEAKPGKGFRRILF